MKGDNMHFWEELEDCKYDDNEFLVEYLIEIVKDENINNAEELEVYENRYYTESGMSKEEWANWYIDSFKVLPEIDNMTNDEVALKVKQLRSELNVTDDLDIKVRNIVMICALLEKEVCFVTEVYNLILGDERVRQIQNPNDNRNIVLCGCIELKDEILKTALVLQSRGYDVLLPNECISEDFKFSLKTTHVEKILAPENTVIIVVNEEFEGIKNYIDSNTLKEITIAFQNNKRIYLLNDIYEPYRSDLVSFGVITLNGNIDKLI